MSQIDLLNETQAQAYNTACKAYHLKAYQYHKQLQHHQIILYADMNDDMLSTMRCPFSNTYLLI